MTLKYIEENYKPGEPIFVVDLLDQFKDKYKLSKDLKKLVDDNKLVKYENGIYYIPKNSILKNNTINPEVIAKYKYVSNSNECYGYYSGLFLANRLGITTQVPEVIDIVSNNTNSSSRIVKYNDRKFYVKPSKVEIDSTNVYVLQLLDLLKDIDKYSEYSNEYLRDKIMKYIFLYNINIKDIDMYIGYFPIMVYKNIYELRLYDVFTQQ